MRVTIDDGYHAYLRALRPAGRAAGHNDGGAPARATREVTILRDAMIIFRYQLRLLLREPIWIVIMMIQPLMYLALFGPLLEPVAQAKGFPPGGAWQVFVPGMLIQLGIFGSMFVGFGIIAEIRYGTVERMRVTPASRLGLLLGRVLRDTLVLLIQATLLTLIAVAFGLRVPASGALITVGIVGMLGIALSPLTYLVATRTVQRESA
jgi:ABC-2 type transport system permease protein